MEYLTHPSFDKEVSRIGLGTWAMGGSLWGETDERESIATIHHAFDLGINILDTAPGYGFGLSEEVIGRAIKQCGKRDQVFIATKCGLNLNEPNNVYRDCRKESISKELEDSLRRLQVDYIDLYQIHWPDPLMSQSEVGEIFHNFIIEGKIKSVGVCNFSLEEIKNFRSKVYLSALQFPFNLFEREQEDTTLRYSKENGMVSMGYSSLCRGLLTGTLREDQIFEELRKNFDPKFKNPYFAQYLICVGRLEQWVRDKYNKPITALAVRWSLDKGVDVALWGARKPEELDPIKTLMDWKLTDDDLKELDSIISETIVNPIGPQFMSPPVRKEELT
jgi:aryl-alcohol dehydrogenase-like predicted oxidoreductase